MLFAIGVKVQFRHTGESGTVTALLGDGLLEVRLDSDPLMCIPAFEEDLMPPQTPTSATPPAYGVPKAPVKQQAPARRLLTGNFSVAEPQGISLVFEPMPGRDGSVLRYKVWLLNDTQYEFIVSLDLTTTRRKILSCDDKLPALAVLELGDMATDDLNEHPEVWLSTQRITTAGMDDAIEKRHKIKPRQFFQHFKPALVLGVPAYHISLVTQFDVASSPADVAGDDLAAYTKRAMSGQKPRRSENVRHVTPHDVEAYATFTPEIDLHIESLLPGHRGVDKSVLLRLQMQHFQRFLEKAVLLGVPRVFVIHGVGEGKLKEAIATVLRTHPHVVKFKNEYHYKYGYGATEIIFD